MKKTLYLLPVSGYNEVLLNVVKEISSSHERPCFVTLNKTANRLKEMMTEKGIETGKFSFLDSITPRLFSSSLADEMTSLLSLDDMNQFAEKIITSVKMHKSDIVIIDSLSSLLAFKSDKECSELMDYLLSFMERLGPDVIIFALGDDDSRPFIKQVEQNVDIIERM